MELSRTIPSVALDWSVFNMVWCCHLSNYAVIAVNKSWDDKALQHFFWGGGGGESATWHNFSNAVLFMSCLKLPDTQEGFMLGKNRSDASSQAPAHKLWISSYDTDRYRIIHSEETGCFGKVGTPVEWEVISLPRVVQDWFAILSSL